MGRWAWLALWRQLETITEKRHELLDQLRRLVTTHNAVGTETKTSFAFGTKSSSSISVEQGLLHRHSQASSLPFSRTLLHRTALPPRIVECDAQCVGLASLSIMAHQSWSGDENYHPAFGRCAARLHFPRGRQSLLQAQRAQCQQLARTVLRTPLTCCSIDNHRVLAAAGFRV